MGKPHTVALLHEPVPLTHGKTAMVQYAVGRQFVPDLRQERKGIQVCHFAFARAGFSALARLWNRHHQSKAADEGLEDNPFASEAMLDLLAWVVATPCAVHDTIMA